MHFCTSSGASEIPCHQQIQTGILPFFLLSGQSVVNIKSYPADIFSQDLPSDLSPVHTSQGGGLCRFSPYGNMHKKSVCRITMLLFLQSYLYAMQDFDRSFLDTTGRNLPELLFYHETRNFFFFRFIDTLCFSVFLHHFF